MQIRRYHFGEELAIWRIVFEASREGFAGDYHPELIERWAPHDKNMDEWTTRLSNTRPFVAVVDNELAGMAELLEEGFIDHFYVRPDFQRRGVGTLMMKQIKDQAHLDSATHLSAHVSIGARPFFETMGFNVTASRKVTILGRTAENFAMRCEL